MDNDLSLDILFFSYMAPIDINRSTTVTLLYKTVMGVGFFKKKKI